MPEIRIVSTTYGLGGYDPTKPNNNLVAQETREVSDAELAVEAAEAETAQANDQALVAYQGWGSLTLAQKDRVLKALLGDFIARHRGNYI